MDREYLEDYEAKEAREYELLKKKIQEGKFDFEKDKYPPADRFRNLHKPVAHALTPETCRGINIWAQVPFCGSLLIDIVPLQEDYFEQCYFKVSEIQKIVDFIKETGRLQIVLSSYPLAYQGFDYLDPIFEELNPPYYGGIPNEVFGDEKEVKMATESFLALAHVRFLNFIKEISQGSSLQLALSLVNKSLNGYVRLKLCNSFKPIIEDIEDFMIDDPRIAFLLLHTYRLFITDPIDELLSTAHNMTLGDIKIAQTLPLSLVYQKENIRFPCEIGKFLFKRLTYAPQGIRACNHLIDNYNSYDLRKVQESLNEAIVTNHPDVVNKSAEDLSEILDNVWNDQTIPKRIQNIKVGLPLSIAAIGSVAGGLIGGPLGVGAGGFLADLGFKVVEKAADKIFSVKGEGLSEKLAKLRTKSYQANIYDFEKKYKGKIAHP